MEGLICAIKRAAVHDGDGLHTTVFFKGCPLRCIWCHNPEGISFQPEVGFYPEICIGCGECFRSCSSKAITFLDGKPVTDSQLCNGCGECATWCPTAARVNYGQKWTVEALTAKLLQAKGICVNIDTCGFVRWDILEQIAPYTDTFLYDIKAIDPHLHKRCTGRDNARILENLKRLCEIGCKVEIRYPYVPGWNDCECAAIGKFLEPMNGITKIKVLGYHSHAQGKYEALGLPCTLPPGNVSAEALDLPVSILRSYGLNAVNGMVED